MNAKEILEAIRRHHRGCAIVHEVTIGDDWSEPGQPSYRRIDALMVDGKQLSAIEIKTSIADSRRETFHKTAPWRRVTHRYVYVVPAGLIDHPPLHGAGLWWVHDDGRVEVHSKAIPNRYPDPLPMQVVQVLMYRAAAVPMNSDGRSEDPQDALPGDAA